eukprot:6188975-Pleurochrysis_carterae.AAC.1
MPPTLFLSNSARTLRHHFAPGRVRQSARHLARRIAFCDRRFRTCVCPEGQRRARVHVERAQDVCPVVRAPA